MDPEVHLYYMSSGTSLEVEGPMEPSKAMEISRTPRKNVGESDFSR